MRENLRISPASFQQPEFLLNRHTVLGNLFSFVQQSRSSLSLLKNPAHKFRLVDLFRIISLTSSIIFEFRLAEDSSSDKTRFQSRFSANNIDFDRSQLTGNHLGRYFGSNRE
ncbi:hypothetical protein NPIL_622571 [Nephila pilipes]|uniref:Uncharacterized protein n=1 Tax=Nephila pilipes TaxID=299642 RepID=A0A8X6MS70_NEPPI|nr:hypothetical protein NPIL_622571 [Nephila pilipes]